MGSVRAMSKNVVNFNAGPAGLPKAALERAQRELLDFEGSGISIIEHSHRGKLYEAVHREAIALTKELLGVPDTHDILFLQGGASQLFATVPMNFLQKDGSADYILTGTQEQQVARIGNSVSPPVAQALVQANAPSPTEMSS